MGWLQFKPYVLRVWCTEREDIWEGCPGHPEKTSHRDKNRLSNYALNSIPSPILVAWSALVHCTRSCILHTYPWELHRVHAEENDTLYPVSSNILSFVSVVLLASSVQLLLCEVPFLQIIDFPENQTGESFLCPPSHARPAIGYWNDDDAITGCSILSFVRAQEEPPCRAWTTTSHMAPGRSRLTERRPVEVRKDSRGKLKCQYWLCVLSSSPPGL